MALKEQSKTKVAAEGSHHLPFLHLIDSSAQNSRRGRGSACSCSSLCHFDLAWCRRSSGLMAPATSELYRCLRWCDDPSLRINEQTCLSSILMGNSLICARWYLNCAILVHSDSNCTQRSICKKAILSRRGKKWNGQYIRCFLFYFFKSIHSRFTCVGAKIHIYEA